MAKPKPRTSDEMIADAKAALGLSRNRPPATPSYPKIAPPSYPTIAAPSYPHLGAPSYPVIGPPASPTTGGRPDPGMDEPPAVRKGLPPPPPIVGVRRPAPASAPAPARPTGDRPTPQQTARVIVRSLAVGWLLLVLLGIVVRLLANLG